MNDMNSGCGCNTVDEYSGWNCVPIYHRFSGISTISTRFAAGLTISERHRHRYEFNNAYKDEYESAGMKCVGINPAANLVEIVEIPGKKWYIGTQFHPEYSSTVLHPHPLFMSFVKACI